MRKPDRYTPEPILNPGTSSFDIWKAPNGFDWITIGHEEGEKYPPVAMNIDEARRLHTWLGKAIEWMEAK